MKAYRSERVGYWLGAVVVLLAWHPAVRAGDEEELRDAFGKAVALQKKARYAEAERHYLKALELAPKVFGEEHPNPAAIINNLAGLYWAQGQYAKAEPLC